MAGISTIATIVGAGISLVGGLTQAAGQRAAGDAALEDARFEARQLERTGKEEFAASQREALAARREGRLAASRGQAVAAASGGGAGSEAPTIVQLLGEISGQSELNAETALYRGESRRKGFYEQAQATRRTGRSRQRGYYSSAAGSIFSSIGSAFGRLGSI